MLIQGLKQDNEPGGDWPVREAVGSLMWLSTMTRPDITNTVRAVARYAHEPTERLWQAITKVLSYLNGTKSLGITYVRGSGLSLIVCTQMQTTQTTKTVSVRCRG